MLPAHLDVLLAGRPLPDRYLGDYGDRPGDPEELPSLEELHADPDVQAVLRAAAGLP